MEVRVEDSLGVTVDPFKLACFGYGKNELVVWGRRGELSLGHQTGGRVLVKVDVNPMRIDFFFTASDGQDWVTPGIFKFDGDKLMVVEPTAPSAHKYREEGVYPNRPTGFTPTKANKYRKRTLVPCKLYDQD